MRTDCRDPRWHILYVDTLLAKGETGTLPNVAAGIHSGILDVTGNGLVRRLWCGLCGLSALIKKRTIEPGAPCLQ